MRLGICFGIMCLGLAAVASSPAKADLIGTGTNSVDPSFYLGADVTADQENEGTQTLVSGLHYGPGAQSETSLDFTGTQITLTNDLAQPYCSGTLPCTDSFTGFDFVFSSGVDITGVSVDVASAADFSPTALTLVSPNEILLNLTGVNAAVGDQLKLDLTFPGSTTSAPEPLSLALFGTGLAGLLALRHRRSTLPGSRA